MMKLTIDKITPYEDSITSKIGETKEIEFEILNDCDYDYKILNYEISGDIKNISIQGLIVNKFISSKKLPFKVIISPTHTGKKTISFFINTDIGQMYVSSGINATY